MRSAMTDAVNQALQVFAESLANPREVTGMLIEIWVSAMEMAGLSPEEVLQAARHIILTEKFFPTPAQVIQSARPREDEDASAEMAWQRVRDCVRNHGPNASLSAGDFAGDVAALWAVSRIRWEGLCETLTDDNRAIFRAEFVRLYLVARREGLGMSYLPGRFERLNDSDAHNLTPALVGRPDWKSLPAEAKMLPAAGILDALEE